MSNKIRVLSIAIMSVLVFCAIFFYSKQTVLNTVEARNKSAKLALQISTSQESYLLAEPISVNLKLSNQTDQPISWRGSLKGGPNINLLVRNDAGVNSRLDGNSQPADYYFSLKVMPPGEEAQESLLIVEDSAEYLFPSPGRYNLQVEFVYYTQAKGKQQTKILSNSITVNILEPQGINRQAYQHLKKTLEPALRQTNAEAIAQAKQEFVNRYKDSVYAKYIIFSLANNYQTLGQDAKALRELCKISGENFHYSKDVERAAFRINEKLHPVVLRPLPEDAPLPIVLHPCTGKPKK